MAIEVACPTCGAVLPAPDELAGQKIRCADCEAIVEVPGTAAQLDTPPPVAVPEPRPDRKPPSDWEDDEPKAAGQRASVLTGTAVGWLLVLGVLACVGLALLGMALVPV